MAGFPKLPYLPFSIVVMDFQESFIYKMNMRIERCYIQATRKYQSELTNKKKGH